MKVLEDNWRVINDSLRIIYPLFRPQVLKKQIYRSDLNHLQKTLIDYTLNDFVSRFALSYIFTFTKKLENDKKVGLTLLIGFVSAIDNLIDHNQNMTNKDFENLISDILSYPVFNKYENELEVEDKIITLQKFKDEVYKFYNTDDQKYLNDFLYKMSKYEINFRKQNNENLQKERFLPLQLVEEYRKSTTLKYMDVLSKFSNFPESIQLAVYPGTWLIQYLDDLMDARKDYENYDVNLYLSILEDNKELNDFLDNRTCKKSKKQISKLMNKLVDEFDSLMGRFVFRVVIWIFQLKY